MEKYTKGEVLGKGTFGTVVKAIHKETGQVVAIKKISLGNASEGVNVTALREIKLLKELRSPYLVQLFDCIPHKKRNLQLVFEYCETDLELVIKDRSLMFSAADVKSYMQMILQGLAFCHDHWVLHRDVKPNNFLVSPTGELKLGDFGLARIFGSPDRKYTNQVFARWYRSPELLFGSTMYTSAVDVWAVGCILAELLLRRPWFPGETDIEQLSMVFRALGTPTPDTWPGAADLPNFLQFAAAPPLPLNKIFPGVSEDALDLLSRMMAFDPSRRISAANALKHRYFRSQPPPTPPAQLPRPALRHPAPGFLPPEENTADIDEAATDSNRGERRQSRKRRCPKNGASEHADATMRPTSAAAAFDAANTGDKVAPSAAQAEGKRCSDDFSGEMAVSIQSSIEPTPDHGCDRRRDATSRRLQLDSEEGATKRRKTVDGLALPRMSDVGTANGHNPSDADTPFTFASIPGADDTTGDSIGLEAAERPQLASKDLAYLRNRTLAMGNALAAAGPTLSDAASHELSLSSPYGTSFQ